MLELALAPNFPETSSCLCDFSVPLHCRVGRAGEARFTFGDVQNYHKVFLGGGLPTSSPSPPLVGILMCTWALTVSHVCTLLICVHSSCVCQHTHTHIQSHTYAHLPSASDSRGDHVNEASEQFEGTVLEVRGNLRKDPICSCLQAS